ncbi:TIGR03943 family protein [Actinoalloteichus sp. AHMU CJ021]|uniref:TIGR03943 family protein n=3 Tax=Actinoalloteichus cyanogriseus TaxID=2893586 RepID=A0ABT1JP10_ACTCY|nr:TIGR03943 family protein [Actinoalloteichus caeruleus]AUS80069.1 TIGR03943 family protein [Actinoalloteichus sp. AHMU CJ021]MCP2334263.1 TIGR03943 family protein [Actinoalloteichus caeruleus DSM 43889]
MRRETQNVLLILLGGALLKISWNETYLRYVRPSLLPLVVFAGVAMILVAALAIARDISAHRDRSSRVGGHSDDGAPAVAPDDGHDHDHGSGRSTWMLLVPVLAILLVAPPALGADSVQRAGSRSVVSDEEPAGGGLFQPIDTSSEVADLQITDVVMRTVWDRSGTLDGRTVRVTGFVVHDVDAVHVARVRIMCCAADAVPVKLRIEGPALAEFADHETDSWVEVTGEVVPDSATAANGHVPTFVTESVRAVEPPSDPYEY